MTFAINANCDGCSACFGQCPTSAINGEFGKRFHIDVRACIDCGVCGWSCPIEAVNDATGAIARRLPRDQRPYPSFNEHRCNGCRICASYCPYHCIEILGPSYAGVAYLASPEACVACDECRYVCMKFAITRTPFDIQTYDPVEERARLVQFLADQEADR